MTSTYRQVVSEKLSVPQAELKPLPRRSTYRPEIDGLRALAVIAVIIFHFNANLLPSGFLGVDIFFVISGFVVTASLANKPDQSWKDYLLTFYSKRVKRLIPALVVCVVLTSLLGCMFIDVDLTRDSLRTGVASLFGVSNLYILRQKTDYFGQTSELNLFTQTWSLGVETQFYLFFPILLGLCGFSRKRKWQGSRNLFWVVLSLSVASIVGYLYLSQVRPDVAFFRVSARFWELGAGCLMFLVTARATRGKFFRDYCKRYGQSVSEGRSQQDSELDGEQNANAQTTKASFIKARETLDRLATAVDDSSVAGGEPAIAEGAVGSPIRSSDAGSSSLFARLRATAAMAGLPVKGLPVKGLPVTALPGRDIWALLSVLCLVVLWFVNQDFQTFTTVSTVVLTCVLLGMFQPNSLAVKALSGRWLVKIGMLSYSLYLWHWSVIVLSRWTIGISKWTIPIQLLVILGCAIASSHWVEKPLRYAKWSSGRGKTILYALLAVALSTSLLKALDQPLRGVFFTGTQYADAYVSSFDLTEQYEPCRDATQSADDFADCAYPSRPAVSSSLAAPVQPKTIYFVGDSHNDSLQSLASRMVEEGETPRIVMLAREGCLFSLSLMRADTDGQECLASNRAFLTKVLKNGNPGDVVVLTNRQKLYFLRPNALDDLLKLENGMFSFSFKGRPISRREAMEKYAKDLVSVSKALSEKGISLVVQSSLPDWKQRPTQCYGQWFRPAGNLPEDCNIDAIAEADMRLPLLATLRQLEASLPNLHVYDPLPVFCDSDDCKRVSDEGVPWFRDADHLNNYGAEHLYEDFVRYLKSSALIASE